MIDDDDEGLVLRGCLRPDALLVLAKIALFVVFFYALLSMSGLWSL